MCDTCGCDHNHEVSETKTVDVNQSLLKSNEEAAIANKKHFDEKGIYVVNLISSPGSGKTTLLEKTIESVKDEMSMGVLEGDIETELDAERIRAKGVPAVQLTTGGACHLESGLVHKGFHNLEHQLKGKKLDLLFIENVGNLVCPSFFDLGEHLRVVLISVPEGHDKPVKYPKAIRTSAVLVISKSDLLPHFDFDIEKAKKDALALNPSLKIFVTSTATGEGIDEWLAFLRNAVTNRSAVNMGNIEIGHGSGGKLTRDLIEKIFLKYLKSDELNVLEDAATIDLDHNNKTAITTDSYVISPLFFPGGNIGKLAVCGTVNDLAVSGALPKYLTLGMIIEEGFPIEQLEEIVKSISETADNAGVKIVTGDTKVVEKGKCDGIYINTTGVGEIVKPMPLNNIAPGDVVIVTGTIGDHGTAVAIAREEFEIEAKVESDCASLNDMLASLYAIEGLMWMRDPTRGGAATVLVELSESTELGIEIYEESVPVREDVRFIQEMLGYDPLYLANEGKAVIITSVESAESVINKLKEYPEGKNAAVIGGLTSRFSGVRLRTAIGGERMLDMLEEDMLPRIC